MGVTKKPAVVAKTARKVRISRSEAAFAKSQGMSLEELAKSKLPKRGRPKGSKNKPKVNKEWPFPTPKDVDINKLLDMTQHALAIEMKTTEALENLFEEFKAKVVIAERMSFFGRLKFLFTGKL